MTAQIPERLILDRKSRRVESMTTCPPLPHHRGLLVEVKGEEALDQDDFPILGSTACWRGYQGTWEIRDNRLYLVSVRGRYKLTSNEAVFADWVNEMLCVPQGELLNYIHMGFESTYEQELLLDVQAGVVVSTYTLDNRRKEAPIDKFPSDERIQQVLDAFDERASMILNPRSMAMERLAGKLVPFLIDALENHNCRIRVLGTLKSLGGLASPAIPKILEVCRKDHYYSDEAEATEDALRAMGAQAVEPMLQALRFASADDVFFYVYVLYSLPMAALIPRLSEALSQQDGDYCLKLLNVVRVIGREAAPLIPVLLEMFEQTDRFVIASAADCLASMREVAFPHLWRLADSPRSEVAVACIDALGKIDEEDYEEHRFRPRITYEGEDLLHLFARKMHCEDVQVRAAAALGLFRHSKWLVESTIQSALSEVVKSEMEGQVDNHVDQLIHGLLKIRESRGLNERAKSRLRMLINDIDTRPQVRRAAAVVLVETLDHFELEHALAILSEALRDPEDPHQQKYLEAAQRIGSKAAPLIPDVLGHLNLLDTDRRIAALKALGQIGYATEEVVDAVLRLVEHPNRRLAECATTQIGKLGPMPARVIAALVRQLDRGWNESSVAEVLGNIGPSAAAALPELERRVWVSENFSGTYARAIGNIGTREAIDLLQQLCRRPVSNVHEYNAAMTHLLRLGLDPHSHLATNRSRHPESPSSDNTVAGETLKDEAGETLKD